MKRAVLNICFSLISYSVFAQKQDTLHIKDCQYTIHNYQNGTKHEEGCLVSGKREGLWKEYTKEGWLRLENYYIHDKRNGPFKTFFKNGVVNSLGFHKDDLITDTIKEYDNKGMLESVCVWKIEGEKSNQIYNKSFKKNVQPDGTIEEINGKKYVWVDGKRIEL